MAEADDRTSEEEAAFFETARPVRVAPSPHISKTTLTTRSMMTDVLIALIPVMAMAVIIFRWYAVVQVGLCILTCLVAESIFSAMRGRPISIGDGSAAVTGAILGLSLPWSAPWYVPVIGSIIAIGIGKSVFGGLGYNIFNPAMVGRAFVMLSFAKEMGASAYVNAQSSLHVVTEATPLTAAKKLAADLAAGTISLGDVQARMESLHHLWVLFIGNVNGSLGETSAAAILIGGLYLCFRRSASWEIPVGTVISALIFAGIANFLKITPLTALDQLVSGALLFGAFFIATDPVTSPLTPRGKFWFGVGVGALVILLRVFSGYPEGVMFAVLLMNPVVPLLNRVTIPRPVGGPAPKRA